MAEDEELEYTLLNKREVMVYQIPPASSSSGHKADDWKTCIWRGRCRVVGKGADLNIKMLDPSSGALFAQCAIPGGEYDKFVERVIDSSRYFVLKITNGARHAFIGLGFEDRNDAFDFNCTLADFKSTWVDRDRQVEEQQQPDQPAKDFSLKEGQKITINLSNFGGSKRREKAEPSGGEAIGFGLLAPPPGAGPSRRQQQQAFVPPPAAAPAPAAAAATSAAQDDFFDDFQAAPVGFQPASAPAAYVAPAPAPAPMPTPASWSTGPAAAPPSQQQQQPPAQQPAFDPFAGMDMLGFGGSPAAAAPQSQMPGFAAPKPAAATGFAAPPAAAAFAPSAAQQPKARGNDPFDEFDIFK